MAVRYGPLETVLRQSGTGDDDDEEEEEWDRSWEAPRRGKGGCRRWGSTHTVVASGIFFFVLCFVVTVHKPVRRDRGGRGLWVGGGRGRGRMHLQATGGEGADDDDQLSVRAYNDDYGEFRTPSAQLYRMDLLVEPYRTTTLEVQNGVEGAKYSWMVGVIDRDTGDLGSTTLYKQEEDAAAISITCETPGDFLYIHVQETKLDGKGRYPLCVVYCTRSFVMKA
jgi:hypothetical protein